MKRRRRYTDDQIVSILQEHSGGVTAAEVIRRHGIALDTLYRWKRKYRGSSSSAWRPSRTRIGDSSGWSPTRR